MQISREDLSKHYAALSDTELRVIDSNQLTDLALKYYNREVERRHLFDEPEAHDDTPEVVGEVEIPTDWLDSAAQACSFLINGERYAEETKRACAILHNAGIPTQVTTEHNDGMPDSLVVMVPGALNMKAVSVLDRDMFNEESEETWRTHFDRLSDAELGALHPDDICAGLLDRAARLKRVYEEAVTRRKSAAGAHV